MGELGTDLRSGVQLGSKTWPFCGSFGCLIGVRATESMGLRVCSSTHNPKVVSSNLTPATISKSRFRKVLRNERRANRHLQFIAQFAQPKSQTSPLTSFATINRHFTSGKH